MKRPLLSLTLALAGAALCGVPSGAKIKAVTLPEMVDLADGAVVGRIVQREVFRVDHPVDGPELYYTTLTIQGRSLVDGSEQLLETTFRGGFVDERHGAFNSEAPQDHEVAVGTEVVAFHAWIENMGGDVRANALLGSHGGLFPVVENRAGDKVVLGRGPGYAVSENVSLDALDEEITRLAND